MLRIDFLSNFFFMISEHFVSSILNILLYYALPNIFAAFITSILFYFTLAIKNRVTNRFLAFLLILALVTLYFCIITAFIMQFGIYSLFCTGILVMTIIVERF